jgi:p25-alpha
MQLSDKLTLMQESKLLDKTLTEADVDAIFSKVPTSHCVFVI